MITKQALERWLCGPDARIHTPAEIADGLGLPFRTIADTTLLRTSHRLRAVRFTLAVLRDVYPDDDAVRNWLRAPRRELAGRCGLDLLVAGRAGAVEDLAVVEWQRRTAAPHQFSV